MRILLSNDDGVHAAGIKALYKELRKIGKVWVVAPLEERSATGHSLTMHKPLRLIEVEPDFYGVSGGPADCICLGVRQVMGLGAGVKPDLVVSGINRGANLAQDVYYSGTVAAAREACVMGIPSLSVSLAVDFGKRIPDEKLHFKSAAVIAARLVARMMKKQSPLAIPKSTFLNLNVPDLPLSRIKGLRFAQQGFRYYGGKILRRVDHRGRDYYWVGGRYQGFCKDGDTDCSVVESGYASVTPLKLDSTDLQCLASFCESEA